ncbi:MAG: hypothetical protein BroJett013_06880 [Alphaproteobacteria bacterium]|nr:MAG: hypothetical protein BroJett013_06880 [Alphaproteobacteria bacterium]
MTDRELATRIIENDFERSVYLACLKAEQDKVTPANRNAPHNHIARVEARAWDLTKASLARMAERAA